jgi:hypothetical protein
LRHLPAGTLLIGVEMLACDALTQRSLIQS